MPLYVGHTYPSTSGPACTIVAFAKDSENQADVVVYTHQPGCYWVLPAADFEQKVKAPPEAPAPVFSVPLARFQHFKGHLYDVVCRARDPETLAPLLVYRSPEDGATWVRREAMWSEEVTWPDGSHGPRFRQVVQELACASRTCSSRSSQPWSASGSVIHGGTRLASPARRAVTSSSSSASSSARSASSSERKRVGAHISRRRSLIMPPTRPPASGIKTRAS